MKRVIEFGESLLTTVSGETQCGKDLRDAAHRLVIAARDVSTLHDQYIDEEIPGSLPDAVDVHVPEGTVDPEQGVGND